MPDVKKMLVFLLLVTIVTIALQPSFYKGITKEVHYFAFPFNSVIKTDCVPCQKVSYTIDYIGLAGNSIFWYLCACVIVTLYRIAK